jgi:hypothetical protein
MMLSSDSYVSSGQGDIFTTVREFKARRAGALYDLRTGCVSVRISVFEGCPTRSAQRADQDLEQQPSPPLLYRKVSDFLLSAVNYSIEDFRAP